jgi:hypothetical protein
VPETLPTISYSLCDDTEPFGALVWRMPGIIEPALVHLESAVTLLFAAGAAFPMPRTAQSNFPPLGTIIPGCCA